MSYIPLPKRRSKPDFSLTIINVVFLLLLFYLATGSLVKENELDADVPLSKDLPFERLPRPLLLITGDGSLFIDGRPIARGELASAAAAAVAARPEVGFLNVLAERTMPANAFLQVVAIAGESGTPIRVVTLRDRSETAAK